MCTPSLRSLFSLEHDVLSEKEENELRTGNGRARIPGEHFSLTRSFSSLTLGTFVAIVAQLVRAPACGAGGRRFESGLSPHLFLWTSSCSHYPVLKRERTCKSNRSPESFLRKHKQVPAWSIRMSGCAPVVTISRRQLEMGQKDCHREIGKQFARKGIVFITASAAYTDSFCAFRASPPPPLG